MQASLAKKNVYGGSIKLRSGVSALRYRLHNKKGLLNLISDVNGYIRNPIRLIQLNYICVNYNVTLKYPEKLTLENGWFSGFFDACGDIQLHPPVIGPSHSEEERLVNDPQIVISVITKNYHIFDSYKEFFEGTISIISNGRYSWSICLEYQILKFIVKKCPTRASRNNSLYLAPKFYDLVKMKAHNSSNNSLSNKAWLIFNNKFGRHIHTKANNSQYLNNIK